ncbi:MAG: MATE family efflux transporter [Phycisphaerae bacterium]
MPSDETERLPDPPHDPAPWLGIGEVVRLAVPTVLNTVSVTVMQFVDGWMVSKVSKEALSAQFIGAVSSFVPISFVFGVLVCVSTYASQNLGAGRPRRSSVYGWHGLWVAWGAAALMAPLIPAAPHIMAVFGHSPEVTHLETRYFQILLSGVGFALSARALGQWFIGVHRPYINVTAGVVANGVNVFANWVLIFGKFGVPALGLIGAGIGTVIGFFVEAAILATLFVREGAGHEFAVRRALSLRWSAIKDLLRRGAPIGGMFVGEVLMWAIFMGRIVGGFGTAALAAAAILNRYWHLCFVPAIGVGSAVQAIVGRYCGAQRQHLARRRTYAGLLLVEAYMVTMGFVIWFARDTLVGVFNEAGDPEVQRIATQAAIFIVICQAFDAMAITFSGALRGAGDILWPSLVQIVTAYVLGVGASWLVATVKPEWGSLGPWGTVSAYIVVLGCVMWARFASGKWRSMRVVELPPVPVPDEPPETVPPA